MNGPDPVNPAAEELVAGQSPSDLAQSRVTGAWAGYLIFGLCLLVLITFDVRAAMAHEWRQLAGWIVVTAGLILIPTGAANWLRRGFRRRR